MPEPVSPLQHFVTRALEIAPEKREFYDRQIQKIGRTTGKPLYDIQRGKSKNPSAPTLQLIAQVLDQPFELLSKAAAGHPVEPIGTLSDSPKSRHIDDDTVEILSVDLSFSMGPGTTIDDYVEEVPVRFGIAFLRSITRSPFERLRLAKGVGDSMFPTLVGGDVVLIDTTQRMLNKQDGVYAISVYGAAAVKRLRTIGPQRVLIKSDNPAVDDQEVDAEDLMIVGRVIWFGREL